MILIESLVKGIPITLFLIDEGFTKRINFRYQFCSSLLKG